MTSHQISRRRFLGATAVAGAGALAGRATTASAAPPPRAAKVDVAIVGTGFAEDHPGTFERNFNTRDGAQMWRFEGGSERIAIELARRLGSLRGADGGARRDRRARALGRPARRADRRLLGRLPRAPGLPRAVVRPRDDAGAARGRPRQQAALADGLVDVLGSLGFAIGPTAARTGVLVADALLQEAFRSDSRGDAELIAEAKRVLRLYLDDLMARG